MKLLQRILKSALIVVLLCAVLVRVMTVTADASNVKTIRVGVSGGMAPLLYIDEDGEPNGTYVEIMDAVANSVGLSLEYVVYGKQQQAISDLSSGNLDSVLGVIAEDIKSFSDIRLTAEIYSAEICLVTSNSGNGLKSYNPGIYELGTISYSLVSLSNANSMRIVATQDQIFDSLVNGESTIAMAIKPCVQYTLEKDDLGDAFSIDNGYFYRTSYYIAVNRNNHSIYNSLNSGIAKVRSSEEYDSIIEKWIIDTDLAAANLRIQKLLKAIGVGTSVAAIVVLTITVFNWRLRSRVKEKTAELSERLDDLEHSSNLRNALIEQSSAGSMVLKLDGSILLMNDAMRRLANLAYNEVVTNIKELPSVDKIWEMAPEEMDQPALFSTRGQDGQLHTYRYQNHRTANHGERVFIIEDITREEKEKQEAFEESKNKTLNRIIAGIAHEIKNPLTTIRTFSSMIDERGDSREFQDAFKVYVPEEVDRINKMVETLINYARPPRENKTRISLESIIRDSLAVVYLSSKDKIRAIQDLPEDAYVFGNGDQLRQAVTNILINSVQSVEEKINDHDISGVPSEISIIGRRSGDDLIVEILDHGKGMSEEEIQRCTDPFFTTKSQGTGMGLALTKQFLKENGGKLEIESVLGEYTKMILILKEDKENEADHLDN